MGTGGGGMSNEKLINDLYKRISEYVPINMKMTDGIETEIGWLIWTLLTQVADCAEVRQIVSEMTFMIDQWTEGGKAS
jgi:hypothetical protein